MLFELKKGQKLQIWPQRSQSGNHEQHYYTMLATAIGNCDVTNVTYNENKYYVITWTVYLKSRWTCADASDYVIRSLLCATFLVGSVAVQCQSLTSFIIQPSSKPSLDLFPRKRTYAKVVDLHNMVLWTIGFIANRYHIPPNQISLCPLLQKLREKWWIFTWAIITQDVCIIVDLSIRKMAKPLETSRKDDWLKTTTQSITSQRHFASKGQTQKLISTTPTYYCIHSRDWRHILSWAAMFRSTCLVLLQSGESWVHITTWQDLQCKWSSANIYLRQLLV